MKPSTPNATAWTNAGGRLRTSTSENSAPISAACSSDGTPLAFVRPALARPKPVAIASSKRGDGGVSSISTSTGSPLAFHQSCHTPAGDGHLFALEQRALDAVDAGRERAAQDEEALLHRRVQVLARDRAAGAHVQVHEHRLAGSVLVAAQDDRPLAGHVVHIQIAVARHGRLQSFIA